MGRRRRRTHSDEFKATVVAACLQPGVSNAAVALAHGINANLARRWVREAEMRAQASVQEAQFNFAKLQLEREMAERRMALEEEIARRKQALAEETKK